MNFSKEHYIIRLMFDDKGYQTGYETLGEVKRGKWRVDEEGGYECSECGFYTYETVGEAIEMEGGCIGFAELMPHYCAKCGAKMDGDENEAG